MIPAPSKYLVRFGSPDCTDLHGAFFTSFTDFGPRTSFPIKFSHDKCPILRDRVLGTAYVVPDAYGLRVGFNLDLFDAYTKAAYELYTAGVLTWSAGSDRSEHMMADGASWIKRFWIAEASLTPTPAEPWRDPNPKVAPYTADQIKANVNAVLPAPRIAGVLGWIEHQQQLRSQHEAHVEGLYVNP